MPEGHYAISRLLEEILDGLYLRIEYIENRHGYISYLIEHRLANEKMIQLEVMRLVSLISEVDDYLVEKPYGTQPNTGKCDIWFSAKGIEYWMEVKTRVTNYRKAEHHSKAISRGVDDAIEDFQRLKEYVRPPAIRLGLFAFYPIYPENYDTFNQYHVRRLSNAAGRNISGPSRKIRILDGSFDLYLIEV